jgi:hypothetical protein
LIQFEKCKVYPAEQIVIKSHTPAFFPELSTDKKLFPKFYCFKQKNLSRGIQMLEDEFVFARSDNDANWDPGKVVQGLFVHDLCKKPKIG